jgi:hypothetical protein
VQGGEHEVAGEGRLDRGDGGLLVADLADQHDVGVAAQDRAQGGRERQPRLVIHLHLVDARDAELHRILDRDHVHPRVRDLAEGGVQGGGLARAGRAGHEHHAVRPGDRVVEPLAVAGRHAQVREREALGRVVEDSHDDLLAPHRGQRGDPQVDRPALVRDRHPAVLGTAPLGDVDLGHDLEAGGHAVLDAPVGALHLVQHPVDPVPDGEVVLARLDVDVAGTVVHGLSDQQVDEPDDGGVAGLALDALGEHRDLARRVLLQRGGHLPQLVVGADEALERAGEGVPGNDDRLDHHVGEAGDVVDGDDVGRVDHPDHEFVRELLRQQLQRTPGGRPQRGGPHLDRDQLVLAAQAARHEAGHGRVELGVGEVVVLVAALLRNRAGDLGLGHQPLRDQVAFEVGGLTEPGHRVRHRRGVHHTVQHQGLGQSPHQLSLGVAGSPSV